MSVAQPLLTMTIRRPFHWGIVVLIPEGDAQVPDVDPDAMVSTNGQALVILVRHAQDVDSFDDDVRWAEAEIVFRLLVEEPTSAVPRREVFRGVIDMPSGRLEVGDADGNVVVPAHPGANTVIVTVDPAHPADDLSPEQIQVDLLPGS